MATVTWLIPVKNGMPFLLETPASLATQTYKDFQVLVWDNGSTDGTPEELRKWIPHRLCGQVVTDKPRNLGGSLDYDPEAIDEDYELWLRLGQSTAIESSPSGVVIPICPEVKGSARDLINRLERLVAEFATANADLVEELGVAPFARKALDKLTDVFFSQPKREWIELLQSIQIASD